MFKSFLCFFIGMSFTFAAASEIEYNLRIEDNRKKAELIIYNLSINSRECRSSYVTIHIENLATFRSTQTQMVSLGDIYLSPNSSIKKDLLLSLKEDEGIKEIKVEGIQNCESPRFEALCENASGLYEDFEVLKNSYSVKTCLELTKRLESVKKIRLKKCMKSLNLFKHFKWLRKVKC